MASFTDIVNSIGGYRTCDDTTTTGTLGYIAGNSWAMQQPQYCNPNLQMYPGQIQQGYINNVDYYNEQVEKRNAKMSKEKLYSIISYYYKR